MISYAQNFEDVVLWRVFHGVTDGFYVDVGAFHPEIDSVTKWFYDQGWSGVNIEPVPDSFAVLEKARPRDRNLRAAAGASSGIAQLTVFPASAALSSLYPSQTPAIDQFSHETIQVDVWPLREILEPYRHRPIHFLKIDAEGSERDVLLGMDFTHARPWVIVVESTAPMVKELSGSRRPERTSCQWNDVLEANGYQLAHFDGLNDFYVASEKRELAPELALPVCVFDDYELAAVVREREARQTLQDSHAGLARQVESLRSELAGRDTQLAGRDAQLAEQSDKLAAAQQKLAGLQTELDTAQSEIARLQQMLNVSDSTVTKLSGELAELATALKASRQREAASAQTLQQVLTSKSWRLLEPARRLRNLVLPHR